VTTPWLSRLVAGRGWYRTFAPAARNYAVARLAADAEFVRGHEQTALHQRVQQMGTIPEFLRRFDARMAGAEPPPRGPAPVTISRNGRLDLAIAHDAILTCCARRPQQSLRLRASRRHEYAL
jgi:hypothetical protein